MSLGALPNDDKRRVLDATDIVRLVGEHLAIRPKGREFVGLCPFHDDHAPSMCVVPHKQIYYCFSCGAGGDALAFVMNYHRMSFREALEYLARRGGIELTPRRAGESSARDDEAARAAVISANLTARDFFRQILAHAEHGAAARGMFERRGVSGEMIERFELGAAPDRWDGLALTVARKGLATAPFERAGLLRARERGDGHFDMFRHRAMFPIHDQLGRVLAFGARRLRDEDEPKYLNSPESPVFAKSGALYGLHQAAASIRASGVAVVTEGYMDVIACHQAGLTNVVATLGTALTVRGAAILRRLCSSAVLLFDGDDAGQRAADRALEVLFAEPLDVRIAVLAGAGGGDAKDPDELLRRPGGVDALRRVIDGARDALEYRFERVRTRLASLGVSRRAAAVEEELARLADLGLAELRPVRRQMIVRRLAQLAGVDEATVERALPAGRRSGPRAERGPEAPAGPRSAREHMLGCVLADPGVLAEPREGRDLIAPGAYGSPAVRSVASAVSDLLDSGQSPSLEGVLRTVSDPEAQREAISLCTLVERLTGNVPERLRAYWLGCVRAEQLDAPPIEHTADPGDIVGRLRRRIALVGERGPDPRAVPRPP